MKFTHYTSERSNLRQKNLKARPVSKALISAAILCAGLLRATAGSPEQSPAAGLPSAGPPASSHYLYAVGLPYFASVFRDALPGVFDQAGHERRILQGVVSAGGMSTSFSSTRQLDDSIRLDIGTSSVRSIVITGLQGQAVLQASSAITEADYDLLETLEEDSAEAFLYSFANGARLQWIGANFSPNGVTLATYRGPYYDVFGQGSELKTRPNNPTRNKLYLFDSATKLLAATRYEIQRNGSPVSVEVVFGGWIKTVGIQLPGTIVRKENGQEIFSISVQSVTSVAAQADSVFKLGGL